MRKTGAVHWQMRLGGTYSASPVFADGRIYFLGEHGGATAIAPGREFRRVGDEHARRRDAGVDGGVGRVVVHSDGQSSVSHRGGRGQALGVVTVYWRSTMRVTDA